MRTINSPSNKIYKVTSGLLKTGPQSINISQKNIIKVKSQNNINLNNNINNNQNGQYYQRNQSQIPIQNLRYTLKTSLTNNNNNINNNNNNNNINNNNNNNNNKINNINTNTNNTNNYSNTYGYNMDINNTNSNIPISNVTKNNRLSQQSQMDIQNLGYLFSQQNKIQVNRAQTRRKQANKNDQQYDVSQKACTFQNQDQYIGQWIQNKIHGYGVYKFIKDKLQYRGYFKNGVINGTGTLHKIINKSKPQIIYQGEWIQGIKHGQGKYYYDDRTYYQGNWLKNQKSGKGSFYSPIGTYQGNWLNNQKHGQGILKLNNGTIYQGQWDHDQFIQGQVKYSNGDKYLGSLNNYQRNGIGQYIPITQQQQYKGNWLNDNKQGNAEIIYQNGQKYIGQVKNNKRNDNNSVYQWKNGTKVICSFQNNLPVKGKMIQSQNKSFQFDMTRKK